MFLIVCSVYDTVSQVFSPPFLQRNVMEAERSFRSTYAQSLDVWHLSQEFGSLPALNSTFIVDDPPLDRVIAVPSEPHILFDAYFDLICARPMPVYSVPGLVDHF